VPEGKLVQVQWKVFFADMMEVPYDPALKQTPKAIEVRGVDETTDIFPFPVFDGFMGVAVLFQVPIAGMLVCSNQRRYCQLKSHWADCLPRASNRNAEQSMSDEFVY